MCGSSLCDAKNMKEGNTAGLVGLNVISIKFPLLLR